MNHTLATVLLGRLQWHALPMVRAAEHPTINNLIAASVAAMVPLGAVLVMGLLTAKKAWRPLWRDWLTSLDHKKIGIMYIAISLVMMLRAVMEAFLIRLQQAFAMGNPGFLAPDHFGQLFTTHGTIMIFFMAMPLLTGLINYVMPLQIGARDVRFALLNAITLALTAAGAALVMVSLFIGDFSTGGWSGYPPFTESTFSPGPGVDYWIWAVTLSSIGSTLTGINIAVTIYKDRAPGMTWMRLPLFTWVSVCVAILMIFAMAPLTVATLMLALDRYCGFHFFTADSGGNLMNYANLFWMFGHPEVYILILPAFGVWSEVIPTFCGKTLYGYTALVIATMAIAVLSFTVWLHHFFTMGQTAALNAVFGIATMLIGIPTGVKVYDWLFTLYRGQIRFAAPMLFALLFLVTFVIGGLSGIILANPPVDFVVHNSLFLVAHFHNMLIPGFLFGMIAGVQFWFPKMFGFRLHEGLGRWSFVCWGIGFYLAFMPLYLMGLLGAMRRSVQWDGTDYAVELWVALAGALFLVAGLLLFIAQLWVGIKQRKGNLVPVGDPWDGRSLEWSIAAPPPAYNFAILPTVTGRDAFWQMKRDKTAYQPPERYEAISMPKNTWVAPATGAACLVLGFALVWHIWWLALLGFVLAWLPLVLSSFNLKTERLIPAAEVRRCHEVWLSQVAQASSIPRKLEMTGANQGLARSPP